MVAKNYGVVYTPNRLAEFAAELLYREAAETNTEIKSVLDPACGECALLCAAKKYFNGNVKYLGIDVDKEAIMNVEDDFEILYNDSILPRNVKKKTAEYWKSKMPVISAIIANPPWSSEKIYVREELQSAGFSLTTGQYDSFVLVIVCRKEKPVKDSVTHCFRLTTEERRKFLNSNQSLLNFYNEDVHDVLQGRFAENAACNFDVDTRTDEEALLAKIKKQSISWDDTFIFGRGVEISKTGKVVFCPSCGYAQGYKKSQMAEGKKECTNCGSEISVTTASVQNVISKSQTSQTVQIYVGENVRRYGITGECYIKPNIPGINYKNRAMYNPPKLLVRKTGLGIYASIDYTGSMTSQTVYILKFKNSQHKAPLEYYLALLNSRVVYYFYLKVYGENEWKSHPYFTKQIIYSLPIREYEDSELDKQIIKVATELAHKYEYVKDVQLEKLVMKKYGLSETESNMVYGEMNRLPDLSAINNMKVEVEANV